jgi:transposase InsO family protein
VNWGIREAMTEADIEVILQGAKEKYLEARPRIISDNGPQFIAKDFKEFIRISGMTHVRTSPFYPQSNGKIERWHKSLKGECIRPGTPLSLDDARRLVSGYVDHYNNVRLNSATGYITPKDMLAGRQQAGGPRGAGPETGSCAEAAADSSPAGRLWYGKRLSGMRVRRFNFLFSDNTLGS